MEPKRSQDGLSRFFSSDEYVDNLVFVLLHTRQALLAGAPRLRISHTVCFSTVIGPACMIAAGQPSAVKLFTRFCVIWPGLPISFSPACFQAAKKRRTTPKASTKQLNSILDSIKNGFHGKFVFVIYFLCGNLVLGAQASNWQLKTRYEK